MASAIGLRKGFLGDSPGLMDDDSRRTSVQKLNGCLKYRPAITLHCATGFVIFITAVALLMRIGFSHDEDLLSSHSLRNADQYSRIRTIAASSFRPMTITQRKSTSSSLSSLQPKLPLVEDALRDIDDSAKLPAHPDPLRNILLTSEAEIDSESAWNCVSDDELNFTLPVGVDSLVYHSLSTFYHDIREMACQFKIFVYPHSAKDPYAGVFKAETKPPTGNYASEHYFKMALLNSDLITKDPSEADLFYMPFSIANMRHHPLVKVDGIKGFVRDYVTNISTKYPYWNRTGGADHFFVNCHSIGKVATEEALEIRENSIQVVCSSNYFLKNFFSHKDATIPQVWPKTKFPEKAASIEQRSTLAFFAGAGNSPVRAEVAKRWENDTEIKVHTHRISTPYDEALLSSKFCLHVKGYEVNTARLADAIYYGCVPIIIADYHDLPFNDVLDWSRIALVVSVNDIPKLKDIIKGIEDEEYIEMQRNVMQVRQHFLWHQKPQYFDAFYMVMYELWLRRHVTRYSFSQ